MKLYKLINRLGTYWVIAKDPTDAETKLKTVLDSGDGYGFSSKRIVTEIHLIAEEVGKHPMEVNKYSLTNRFLLIDLINP